MANSFIHSLGFAKPPIQTLCKTVEEIEAVYHEIIEKRGLKQISDDSAIEPIVDEILANNPNQIEQYKSGNTKLLGYFVGQVMKATQGKANPKQVNELLRKKLDS